MMPTLRRAGESSLRPFRAVGWLPLVLLAALLSATPALSATYVVSLTGSDANDGSLLSPWRTIAKANAELLPGDTVFIRAGVYREVIAPRHSGAVGQPIVYVRFPGEDVLLLGTDVDRTWVVGLGVDPETGTTGSPVSHIIIDGFTIRYEYAERHPDVPVFSNRFGYVRIENRASGYNVIRNCTIVQDGDPLLNYLANFRQAGIVVSDAHHTTIEHNDISGMWLGVWLEGASPRFHVIRGNTIHDIGSSLIDIADPEDGTDALQGNLIEANVLSNSANEDGIQFEPNYNGDLSNPSNRGTIIRGNIVSGCAENAFDLKGASDIVIEGNLVFGNRGDDDGLANGGDRSGGMGGVIHGGLGGGTGLPSATRNVIIRNNIFYDNFGAIEAGENYKIYNNTIIGNNRDFTGPRSSWSPVGGPGFTGVLAYGGGGLVLRNNIIGGHANGEVALNVYGLVDAEIDNNFYANTSGARMKDAGGALFTSYDLTAWKSRLSGRGIGGAEAHGLEGDPLLTVGSLDPVGSLQHLAFTALPGSPVVDAGGALTRTTGSGSGNVIPVRDPLCFHAGYGIPDGGDLVVIGRNPSARILGMDTAAGALIVDRVLTWVVGDDVFRPYADTAPDIGAMESGVPVVSLTADPYGKVEFSSSIRRVRDNTTVRDSLRLSFTGNPLKALQLRLITDGRVILRSVGRGADLPADRWFFFSRLVRGPTQEDGSVSDTCSVVILGMNATTLPPSSYRDLLSFTYDVVNAAGDAPLTTAIRLVEVVGAHADGSPSGIIGGSGQLIQIQNAIGAGDINQDDRVDVLDIVIMVEHLLSRVALTSDQILRADVSPWPAGDGLVDVRDLALLQYFILAGAYPDGTPLRSMLQGVVRASSLTKEGREEAHVRFLINDDTLRVQLSTEVPIVGLQWDLRGVMISREREALEGSLWFADSSGARGMYCDPLGRALPPGEHCIATFVLGHVSTPNADDVTLLVVGAGITPINASSSVERSGSRSVPARFSLEQNYPNPFNPSTRIRLSVGERAMTTVKIFTILGQEVVTLLHEVRDPGVYEVDFHAAGLPSGTYICRMQAGTFASTKKLLLIR